MTYRCGFVALAGRPNTGKSTLLNAIVGEQVAIASRWPQTTRHAVRGVLTRADAQLIVVDTPGFHRPRTPLGQRLTAAALDTWAGVDLVAVCLPANEATGPGDRLIIERILGPAGQVSGGEPAVAVVTMADRVNRAALAARLVAVTEAAGEAGRGWLDIVPVSGRTGAGVARLVDVLVGHLPEGPALYPPDTVSDDPLPVRVAELIRKAALRRAFDELPHSLAVTVTDIVERADRPPQQRLIDVRARILVERRSQEGLVIGRGGVGIREIGTAARPALERLLDAQVHLELRVAVAPNWQRDPAALTRLGF